jgi:hypothetical protein
MIPRFFLDGYPTLVDTKVFTVSIGIMISVGFFIIGMLRDYDKALKNEDYLQKLYIKETDERNILIRTKTGGSAVAIILAGLAIGTIISAFFNETVFYTLMSIFVFIALVKIVLKIYYNRVL